MDWANEPYVKVYTRETDDDLLLSWEALSLWRAMLLKFDRSGRLETRRGMRGLAALVRAPLEVVERALPELLDDGRVVPTETGYFAPNFLEAQEASKSDRLRQRESRERRAKQAQESSEANSSVTNRDRSSRDVTAGHAASQVVTLTSADPDPMQREPLLDARSPVTESHSLGSHSEDPQAGERALALQNFEKAVDQRAPVVNAGLAHPRPDPRIKLNHDAWNYAADTHAKLREAGIDRNAIRWSPMPTGAAANDLVDRTREILAGDADIERARAMHHRRVDVAAAEARREHHLKWFTPSRIYAKDSFWKAAEMHPSQVRSGRRSDEQPTYVLSHGDDEQEAS